MPTAATVPPDPERSRAIEARKAYDVTKSTPVRGATRAVEFVVDTVSGTWGRLDNSIGYAGRHAANNLVAYGVPGGTWNIRNAYRTEYKADQRFGAAFGDAMTIGVAGLFVAAWHRKQFAVPMVWKLPEQATRAIAISALTVGAASGIMRTVHNVQDDGDMGIPAAAAAAMSVIYATRGVKGRVVGKLAMIGGATVAAFAGHWLGSKRKIGTGHLGEKFEPSERAKLAGNPLLAGARGSWNHFVEAGPISQGTSFGKPWHQKDAMRERYTDAELVGGMAGDLAALSFVGSSFLVVGARILKRPEAKQLNESTLVRLSIEMSLLARGLSQLKDVGKLVRTPPNATADEIAKIADFNAHPNWGRKKVEELLVNKSERFEQYKGSWPQAYYLLTAGVFLFTLREAYNAGRDKKNSNIGGPKAAAIAGVGMLGGAAVLAKFAPWVRDKHPRLRPATALFVSSAIVLSALAVREPIQSFFDGARNLSERRGGAKATPLSVGLIGAGAASGAALGKVAGDLLALRGALDVAAIGFGAVAGAIAGWAFAPVVAPRVPGRHLGDLPEPAVGSPDRDHSAQEPS